ncbi:MAG TPA: hypothetical protein VM305_07105 [Candidatus Limnocylindrales bacterium]|nr:hypothetical protein [Candidatus Limnocylindrales bacterium]
MADRPDPQIETAVRSTLSRLAADAPLPHGFAAYVAHSLPSRSAPSRWPRLYLAASWTAASLVALMAIAVAISSLQPSNTPAALSSLSPSPSASPRAEVPDLTPEPTPGPTTPASSTAVPTAEPTAAGPAAWTPPPGPTPLPWLARVPRYMTEEEIDSLAAQLMESLFAAYAAGGDGLDDLFTPLGLINARAADPMLAAISDGQRRVHLDHEIVAVVEGWSERWTQYLPDSTPVWIELEVVSDVGRGARIVDGAGQTISETDLPQRLEHRLVAVWDGANSRWQIDELASPALGEVIPMPGGTPASGRPCPWRARDLPPSRGFDQDVDRAWCDSLGRRVPDRHLGFVREAPGHCGWQSASLLHLGPQPGWEIDRLQLIQFVRDPEGLFQAGWLAEYEVGVRLPEDAVDTGLTNGNVRLFHSPSEYDSAIYAVIGETVERWPRMREYVACE